MKQKNINKSKVSGLALMMMLVFFSLSVGTLNAQESVSGSVKDESGVPIPGVNILQKGTNNAVISDFDGKYSIQLNSGDNVLVYSSLGYATKQVQVGDKAIVDVTLSEDLQSLDEVIITGYSTTKRKNILGAVSTVKEEEVMQTTPVNAFDAIQGRMSGVNILSDGGPGSGATIQIRGVSTFEGGVEPLYVVDGQQLDNIDNIDPSDIASIQVLKDGASGAIYGSKSANGVVIITTKRGQSGKTKLDVSAGTVISNVNTFIPLASTAQRIRYEDLRRNNTANLTTQQRDSLSLLYRNSNDLQSMLFRVGIRNQANIALSGGTKTGDFYWNTGFLQEEGTVINSGYKRINTQLKINTKLYDDKVRLGTNLYSSYELRGGLDENSVFQQTVERIPYFPVFEPNGTFTPELGGRQNPVAEANDRRQDDRRYSTRIFNFGEIDLLPQLRFRSTIGINFRFRKENDFSPTSVLRPGNTPEGRERNNMDYDILQENFFTYKQTFGNHNVSAILGNSVQKWYSELTELRSNSFLSDDVETFNAIQADGFIQNNTRTFKDAHTLIGYFTTLQYNYKEKYLVEATIRRDASSRFGENNKFGNFRSASVGWRISGEDFMKAIPQISDLKIRYSYGENGNERIGNYDNLTLYGFGNFYNGVNGIAPNNQLGNPNIKWESTNSSNLGLNLSVFKGRYNMELNAYRKTTTDLLSRQNLPVESGFRTIRANIGSVENKGLELVLNGSPIKTNDFEWYTNFNISTLDNTVLDVADERGYFDSGMFRVQEGESIGNMWGFKNKGIFRYDESNAFNDDGVQLTPNFDDNGAFVNYTLNGQEYTGTINQLKRGNTILRGGDIIWEDLNNDFEITDDQDRQTIGNGLAKYFGGFFNEFKYKEFSFSFLFNYNFGNDIFKRYDQARNDLNSSNETPSPDRIDGAWVKQGDVAGYAVLDRGRAHNRLLNSAYVSPGDFIRLSNIKFSYRLSKKTLEKIGFIKSLNVNLSVNNLVTWTNYDGYNPELGTRGAPLNPGEDRLRYPNKSSVIFGFNLGL